MAVTLRAIQHGFGARLVWLCILIGMLGVSCVQSLTVEEIVEPMVNVTKKVDKWTPLRWYMERESDVSKVLLEEGSKAKAVKRLMEHELRSFSIEQLITGIVRIEDARLKHKGDLILLEDGFEKLREEFLRMESEKSEAIRDLTTEVAILKAGKEKLEQELEEKVKRDMKKDLEAVKEKRELVEALDRAYSAISALQAEKKAADDLIARMSKMSTTANVKGGDNNDVDVGDGDSDMDGPKMAATSGTKGGPSLSSGGGDASGPASYLVFKDCQTIKCVSGKVAEHSFDLLWLIFTDPLSLGGDTWNKVTQWVLDNMTLISCMLGAGIMFVFSNIIVYTIRKFAKVCQMLCRAWVLFLHLPVVTIVRDIIRFCFQMMVNSAEEAKSEREKMAKENKEMKSAIDKLAIAMKKIGEGTERAKRDAAAMMRTGPGNVEWGRQVDERLNRPPPWNRPPPGPSNRQGPRGQDRWTPARNQGGRDGRPGPSQPARAQAVMRSQEDIPVSTQPPDSPRLATTSEPATSNSPTAAVGAAKTTHDDSVGKLLYTPIFIEGVRLPRCLIDTGAQVNLIPKRDVVKQGWHFDFTGAKKICGFDGAPRGMDGVFTGTIKIGPTTLEEVDFQVCPQISVPIVGMDTLGKMGFNVNCRDGKLCQQSTGKYVQCSMVESRKN